MTATASTDHTLLEPALLEPALLGPALLEPVLKALASERRLQILEWLKAPAEHFPPQEHADHALHGACNLFIVDKLGVSQPAGSRHLKVLVDAGLVIATRRKGWTYYRRNEDRIAEVLRDLATI